ncbi:MAG: hypothetical protein AB1394_15110 [Bacteroidota bacterium]
MNRELYRFRFWILDLGKEEKGVKSEMKANPASGMSAFWIPISLVWIIKADQKGT